MAEFALVFVSSRNCRCCLGGGCRNRTHDRGLKAPATERGTARYCCSASPFARRGGVFVSCRPREAARSWPCVHDHQRGAASVMQSAGAVPLQLLLMSSSHSFTIFYVDGGDAIEKDPRNYRNFDVPKSLDEGNYEKFRMHM